MKMEEKKAKFVKIFANLPDKVRNEDIIVVIDNKPFTWTSAMIEIKLNSETSKKILEKLSKMGVI